MAKKEEPVIQTLDNYPPIEFVSSGVEEIDKVVGGFPRGRISEVYGKKGVGKTTLMLMMLAKISKDCKTLFCDVENALNVPRLVELGGDPAKIDFTSNSVLEELGELILANLGKYDVIIVDSIASTVTKTELDSAVGDHNVGVKAKVLNSIVSRRLPEALAKSRTALVLINQLRDSFTLYTPPYTPGGRAIEYAASLRLELSTNSKNKIIKDGEQLGHWVDVKVTKSKVSKPHLETKFKLLY